ncbi:hypothetical protein J3458_012318 [Metarhizium acridum]|uniref:uncharacterized protein n=1 Tax=Metarhizium acridum TaxID=92637 RepID=UPI001C6AC3F0|nr:hypothetical protein J3458_012318 [Metarhizium acridum]
MTRIAWPLSLSLHVKLIITAAMYVGQASSDMLIYTAILRTAFSQRRLIRQHVQGFVRQLGASRIDELLPVSNSSRQSFKAKRHSIIRRLNTEYGVSTIKSSRRNKGPSIEKTN